MANKSLGRKYFLIFKQTDKDSGTSNPDPIGVFSCLLSTARFLNIEDKQYNFQITTTRKVSGKRSKLRADGTELEVKDQSVKDSVVVRSITSKGSKTVTIQTGKTIADTGRTKNKKQAKHTISFRFPGWATIPVIADALAEIIPETKIKSDPGENEIQPFFKLNGGGRYAIQKRAAAVSDPTAQTADTEQKADELAQKSGNKKAKEIAA